jgi:hypothetical protein
MEAGDGALLQFCASAGWHRCTDVRLVAVKEDMPRELRSPQAGAGMASVAADCQRTCPFGWRIFIG